jgi:16S rRNA (guanine527-N7)-methyltransferase
MSESAQASSLWRDIIPWLKPDQLRLLQAYAAGLQTVNEVTNLISRRSSYSDIVNHIAHCLCMATRSFPEGSRIVDWGTGGGLPLIPLAISYPSASFVGVDAVLRKIDVVQELVDSMNLSNVSLLHARAEKVRGVSFTHAVSRATAPLKLLWRWSTPVLSPPLTTEAGISSDSEMPQAVWPSGLICLKGGDLKVELADFNAPSRGLAVNSMPCAALGWPTSDLTKMLLSVHVAPSITNYG